METHAQTHRQPPVPQYSQCPGDPSATSTTDRGVSTVTRNTRNATVAALLGLGVALAASGCAGGSSNGGGSTGGSSGGGSANGQVKVTLWDNATTGPGQEFFVNAAKAYHTLHPNVTINLQTIQNEDLDG